MKTINKFLSVIIVVTILLSSQPSNLIFAETKKPEMSDAPIEVKTYCTATIDDQFADDRILVVLNREASSKLNTYISTDFAEINAKAVIDLTHNTKNKLRDKGQDDTNEIIASSQNDDGFGKKYNQILLIELDVKGKQNVLQAIKTLESRDDVLYVGPDYQIFVASTMPNDELYQELQNDVANKIKLPEAWAITTGSSIVKVGVVDTGIDGTHEDLIDRVDENLSRDFSNGTEQTVTSPTDEHGHGTHVAGIIGASGGNTIGVSGVCWNVSLVSLQVLDSEGSGYSSNVVAAVDYANAHNISILNMSIAWNMNILEHVDLYNEPVNVAISNYFGLVVCAAGNSGTDNDIQYVYPASYKLSNIISVANVNQSDELASASDYCDPSSYGKTSVHLAAPGCEIFSTYPGDAYVGMSGTSMAAPYVAGVAALIKSIRPNLSALEIKELILDNVDKLTSLQDKCITGGRLNAYKAVLAATEPETFTGDVNGDGRADVILSRGVNGKRAITTFLGQSDGRFSEPITTQMTNNFFYDDPAFVGDFNGDGLTDVVIHWDYNNHRQLLVYVSKGDGTYHAGTNLVSARYHDTNLFPCSYFVADVNGDGKDDFIVHYRNANGNRSALVYKGKESAPYLDDATTDALTSTNEYRPQDPVFVGDFNGDGYADMLVHWVNSSDKRQLLVYTGKSDGTFNSGAKLSSSRYHKPETYPTKFFVTDVNGDGKDDFVVHWQNSDGKRCNLVYKGKSSSPYFSDATSDAIVSANNYVETDPVYVGDINGDGRSDMVVHWANSSMRRQFLVYTANSNGTYNAAIRISTSEIHNQNIYATMLIADVNGDGCDDFVVKRKRTNDGVQFLIYLGATDGTLSEALYSVPTTFIPYFDALPT